MTMQFDVAAIRAQFPILTRTIHGRPLAYLDSAASAQKPNAVIDAMSEFQRTSYANVHRGLHTLANEATQAFEDARKAVAGLLGAGSVNEIIFTRGSTEAINLLANCLAPMLKEGDEIILTDMEHHANIVPWHMLRVSHGIVLKWVPVRDDGSLDLDALAGLITPRTRLITLAHMSNVLGTVNDLAAVTALARAHGVPVMADGSQAVVHGEVHVAALGVDFYCFTGHKLYGPTGIGALWAKAEWLDRFGPWQGGGEMIETVSRDSVTYNVAPHRFEAGTPAITEAVGLKAAIDWVQGLDRPAVHAHEARLLARLHAGVRGINGLRIHGNAPGKGAVMSFSLEGAHPHDIAQLLDRQGVAVRAGHHCAQPLMTALGVTATARASLAAYSNDDDIDAFLSGLEKARDMLVGT
jgi:cysteine desulfurase / selenocysteine lyase